MRERTKKTTEGQRLRLVDPLEFQRGLRDELRHRMSQSMLEVVGAIFTEERHQVCGSPWTRKPTGAPRRGGTEAGRVYLAGRRVPVRYPRVAREGRSEALPAYTALGSLDLLGEEVQGKLLHGVATRDYANVSEVIAEGTHLSSSTVSRAFVRASKKSIEELNGRPLHEYSFAALFFDGIGFGRETTVVTAMGVTTEGHKIILGFQEGHTENAAVVDTLLENLVDRGLALEDVFLVVLDGGKALRKAVEKRWGARAVIQRCQAHKKRNVLDHLPKSYHAEMKRRLSVAYGMKDYAEAKRLLESLAAWLRRISEPAARSLEEGLEETLTVTRLGLPDDLKRTFSTTNSIESIFDGVRYRTRRVKRWRSSEMAKRWTAGALLVAEKRLHRVGGYKQMPELIRALKALKSVDMERVRA